MTMVVKRESSQMLTVTTWCTCCHCWPGSYVIRSDWAWVPLLKIRRTMKTVYSGYFHKSMFVLSERGPNDLTLAGWCTCGIWNIARTHLRASTQPSAERCDCRRPHTVVFLAEEAMAGLQRCLPSAVAPHPRAVGVLGLLRMMAWRILVWRNARYGSSLGGTSVEFHGTL